MSKGPAKQRTSLDGLVRASWDTQRDLELMYGVTVNTALIPQVGRRGIYRVRLVAVSCRGDDRTREIARYEREYPNADNGSLEALQFSALNRLGVMLGDMGRAEQDPPPF